MTEDEILWYSIMNDPDIDEIGAMVKGDRIHLRWKYPNGPNHYRWFKR